MGGGSSTQTCDCCASFITFCEDTFGTNNCTLCGVDIAATGIEFLGDYLHHSKIKFLQSTNKGTIIKNIPYKANANIDKGILDVSTPSGLTIYSLLQNPQLFTVVSDGTFYISGLSCTLIFFKKNIPSFIRSVNIFTSMASSYIIKNANQSIDPINTLFLEKLGFSVNTYNYYLNNPYYDYNATKNVYALELVRINSLLVFIWHIIQNEAVILNIDLTDNYPFYIQFYLSIFENLNGTKPILSSQINPYFVAYSPNLIPSSWDPIITKWAIQISVETDLTQLLILKLSSRLLSQSQLLKSNLDDNNNDLKLSPDTMKDRFNECVLNRNFINRSNGLPIKP